MPLEVGQKVTAVVSDASEPVDCRIEEIVDAGREIVRVSFDWQETETERKASRVHGKVKREHTLEAWKRIERGMGDLSMAERGELWQAIIAYSDIECRNVLREVGVL